MLQSKQDRYRVLMIKYCNDPEFQEMIALVLHRYEVIGNGDKMKFFMQAINEVNEKSRRSVE